MPRVIAFWDRIKKIEADFATPGSNVTNCFHDLLSISKDILRTYSTEAKGEETSYSEDLRTTNERVEELEARLETGLGLVEKELCKLRKDLEAHSISVTDVQSRVDCHTEIILGVRILFPSICLSLTLSPFQSPAAVHRLGFQQFQNWGKLEIVKAFACAETVLDICESKERDKTRYYFDLIKDKKRPRYMCMAECRRKATAINIKEESTEEVDFDDMVSGNGVPITGEVTPQHKVNHLVNVCYDIDNDDEDGYDINSIVDAEQIKDVRLNVADIWSLFMQRVQRILSDHSSSDFWERNGRLKEAVGCMRDDRDQKYISVYAQQPNLSTQPPRLSDAIFPGLSYIPSDPGSPCNHQSSDISEKLRTLAYLLSLALLEQDSKTRSVHKELVTLKGLENRSLVSAKNIYAEYKEEYDKLLKHGTAQSLCSQMGTTLTNLGNYLMLERDVSTLSNAMILILDEQLVAFVTREGGFLDSLSNLDQLISGMPSVALINAAQRLSGESIVDTRLWHDYGHVYSELRALITDPQETTK